MSKIIGVILLLDIYAFNRRVNSLESVASGGSLFDMSTENVPVAASFSLSPCGD